MRFWRSGEKQERLAEIELGVDEIHPHDVFDGFESMQFDEGDYSDSASTVVDEQNSLNGDEQDSLIEARDPGTKKRKNKDILGKARDAKKRKQFHVNELLTQFYEGKIQPDGDRVQGANAAEIVAPEAQIVAPAALPKPFRYRVAMQRLDESHPWYLKSVAACANISEKTLRAYHDVWKKLGQSDEANREEIFEYFVEHKKPGPQMADPVAMWRMSKRADLLIDHGQGQKCSTIRRVFRNVALPELQTVREQMGKNVMAGASTLFKRSFSAMRRLVLSITPHVRNGMTKLSQDRLKASKNPAGGMSLVAGLQHITRGIHKHNIICFDSVTTYVNENVPQHVYLTQKKKKQLESRRRGVKASTGNAQRRSLKINLGIKRGAKALVSYTAIVSDTEFTSLKRFAITPEYDILFCPHSPEDEKVQHDFENVDVESLKYRQSKMLYDECVIPKCLAHGQAMMDFARNVLKLPDEEVQQMGVVLIFQDGEGGVIHHIMNKLAGKLGEVVEGKPSARLAKGPNASTEGWQVNDVCGLHPQIHEGFKSEEFCCMSKDEAQAIIDEHPGLIAALKHLNDSGMNSKSKETYSNALCYLIPLVQKAATPAMVDEGFDQAGLHPLNYGKIMHNMYDHFDDLTQEQAAELIRVASVELGEVFKERGLIYGRESEAACAANPILNRVMEFPEMPANLEHLAWNRQTLVDCSHDVVQRLNAERIVVADEVRQANIRRKATAAELESRLMARFTLCCASQDEVTKKYKCHCGGMFDGRSGFKSHESSNKKHAEMYGKVNEHGEYVK